MIIRSNVPAIYSLCCRRGFPGFDLDRPWIDRGELWATDMRAAVRCPLDDLDLTAAQRRAYRPGNRRLPAAWKWFDDSLFSTVYVPLPEHILLTALPERVRIGDRDFNALWIAHLVQLGCKYANLECGVSRPLRFQVDKVSGVLMPLRGEMTP